MFLHLGTGGWLYQEGGNSSEIKGGSPSLGCPSQSNFQEGGSEGLLGGLLDRGKGHGMSQVLVQSLRPMAPPMNGGLKEMTLAIFDSNRKHTKQFTQEFTLYRMVNQDSPTICNTYTQTVLALSFMQGPTINNWVLQQIERLYVKCNRDTINRIVLTYQTDDKWLWMDFSLNFHYTFTNTTSEQCAYGELANCFIGS